MVFVLLGVCVFLPLGVHVFVLAQLNRRRHPVMVDGVWDFAGVLFALSGFLLLGGPFVLATWNQDWRDFWLHTSFRMSLPGKEAQESISYGKDETLSQQWWYVRLGIWILYFAVVVIGAIVLLRRRSRVTCIYNVDAESLEQSLVQVLNRLHLKWNQAGPLFYIQSPSLKNGAASAPKETVGVMSQAITREGQLRIGEGSSEVEDQEIVAPQFLEKYSDGRQLMVLEVNAFPAMCHATLQWSRADRLLRREIETELARQLKEMESPPNPAGTWLMSVAAVLMCVVCFCLLLLILFSAFVVFGSN